MTKRLLLAHSSPAWELKEFSGDRNSWAGSSIVQIRSRADIPDKYKFRLGTKENWYTYKYNCGQRGDQTSQINTNINTDLEHMRPLRQKQIQIQISGKEDMHKYNDLPDKEYK